MRCSSCSREIPDAAKFCPHCGGSQLSTPIQKPTPTRDLSKPFILLIGIGIITIILGLIITLPGLIGSTSRTTESDSRDPTNISTQAFNESIETAITLEENLEPPTPTVTTEHEQTPLQPSASPTTTPSPIPQKTSTATPMITSESTVIEVNPHDGAELVQVPAGEFLMGSDSNQDPYFWGAEGPQHPVSLDAYWIYRTEVTNTMYQACVAEQKCPRPVQMGAVDAEEYYENSAYADYPVIYVSFTHAAAYCHWVGGRLPTEAEWEKAARGTDGRLFPWGNESPGSDMSNLCDRNCARGEIVETQLNDGFGGTSPVGSFPAGVSSYGALDMAGNVWEWTFDWFQSTFYSVSPYENPNGPVSGTRHVIRGGSWSMPIGGVRVVARISKPPDTSLDNLGFRCVVDVTG